MFIILGVPMLINSKIITNKNIIKKTTENLKFNKILLNKKIIQNNFDVIEILTFHRIDDDFYDKNIGISLDVNLIYTILIKQFKNVSITKIRNKSDLNKLAKRKPNLVFSGIKYFDFSHKKIWLNEFLDQHGISYISSKKSAYDNEKDKSFAKKIMQKNKIETSQFFIAKPGQYKTESSLPLDYPLFVKPLDGGDSIGIDKNSIVYNFKQFQEKVLEINLNQKSVSIVENYLSGKEYSVGIFEHKLSNSLLAMPIEIIVKSDKKGHRILDYHTKQNDTEKVTAVTNPIIHKQLCDLAKKAFKVLKGSLIGRIDIKMNDHNIPHFIEANLMPGLKKGYFYRSCAINLKINYEQMILKIASNALSSSNNKFNKVLFLRKGINLEKKIIKKVIKKLIA
jgi:D-alanine-D-alanine ligase